MQNAGDEYACLWMCFVPGFVRACPCIYSVCRCGCALKKCAQLVCSEVSVKVCLSVMMERQGSCHLTQRYQDTEPYVSARSWQLRPSHPSSTLPHLQHPPVSLPLSDYPVWVTARAVPWNRGTNTNKAQDVCRGVGTISWDQGVRELRASMLTSLSWLVISYSIMSLPL